MKQCTEQVYDSRTGSADKLNAEKFAELIVRECMNLAITEEEKYSFSNSTPAKYFTAAISDFQGVLAKHFGVEE